MAGRPSKYSEALARKICDRIAAGESVRSIASDKDMPTRSTITKWLSEKPEFSDRYAQAQDQHFDDKFDAIEAEVRACPADSAEVQKMRLLVDTVKWRLAKMRPKKYGDKQALTNADGDGPAELVVSWGDGKK